MDSDVIRDVASYLIPMVTCQIPLISNRFLGENILSTDCGNLDKALSALGIIPIINVGIAMFTVVLTFSWTTEEE